MENKPVDPSCLLCEYGGLAWRKKEIESREEGRKCGKGESGEIEGGGG